jgi:hypothetical protein
MDEKNVVAARLGLPFKCGMCSQVHEKADLSNNDVCSCFTKVWDYILSHKGWWLYHMRDKRIRKPEFGIYSLNGFNVPKIIHSYPIEQDVFMLAFPLEKAIENLKKKFIDWKDDCIKQQVRLIEEKGELENVKIKNGVLYINDNEHISNDYPTALLMMKSQEIALAFACIHTTRILDMEWRSIKDPAKILIVTYFAGKTLATHIASKRFTIFASEETGVVQVPNRIRSVREAENYLRELDSHKKNMATLRVLFGMADHVIRNAIPFVPMSNPNKHEKNLLPALDESRVQDTRVLIEESIRSIDQIGVETKCYWMPTIKACLNALDALEKAYKSISNDTGNDTIENNLSQALYWIAQTNRTRV